MKRKLDSSALGNQPHAGNNALEDSKTLRHLFNQRTMSRKMTQLINNGRVNFGKFPRHACQHFHCILLFGSKILYVIMLACSLEKEITVNDGLLFERRTPAPRGQEATS